MTRPGKSTPAFWPLVGRTTELSIARASVRDRRGVVVLGEAGVGKTRLASELVRESTGTDVAWHSVVGSSGAARVPLGAWSHLLPNTWEPAGNDVATWRYLTSHLRAPNGEIHLLVDDAHWLDSVSVGFLHHLLVTGLAKALVTARRDEGNDKQLTTLWKDGHLTRLDLEPFGYDDTEAALEAALGDPIEPRTARRFHEQSGGNILMLRELVDAGRTDGTLRRAHGAWIQAVASRPSPRLADLLSDRIEGLGPDEVAGAELVALGEPIPEELLRQVVESDVVRRLVSRRLVHVEGVGHKRIARSVHPLIAQVLVERMAGSHRDAAIASLIALFESADAELTGTDVMRLALWRLDIGADLEGGLALRAAELALARTDFVLAERFAARAVDGGETTLGTVMLGEALVGQQRHAAAERVLAPLHGDVGALDEVLRMRYAQVRAIALGTELGRVDDAVAVLQSTLATLPVGPRRRMLEARVADLLADSGLFRAAAPLADARIKGIADDEVAALCAFVAEGLIRMFCGRCRDTLELCDLMLPVALRHREEVPAGLGWIAAQRMLALYVVGDLAAASEFGGALEVLVADDPDTTLRAGVLMFRGMVAADEGRLEEALRLLQRAAALHELDNRRGYQSFCFAITSRVHAQRGDLDAAALALDAARRHLWPGGQVFSFDVDAAAIWLSALRGDRREAQRELDQAVAHAQDEGMVSIEIYLRHEAIRAGFDPKGHAEALAQLAEVEQSQRGVLLAQHARALATDDADGLAATATAFAELGQHLRAAEAFAQAAVRYRRAGSPGSAARAKARSQIERTQCVGAVTPALQDDPSVLGLTGRELDVATLAASGATNQDIAARLGISVRTVETHLQRAFDKLGVHRRGELPTVFDRT